jgi:hypothetical protein
MPDFERQSTPKSRNKISWHFNDLLGRDIAVAIDCAEWLKPNQRDIDRRARPKRLSARYLAACMVIESTKNPAFAKEIMDRTEGKVADRLISDVTKTVNIRIELAGEPQHLVDAHVDGEVVTDSNALTVVESKTSK